MIQLPDRVNIAAYLPAMARQQPHRQAVVFPQTTDENGKVAYTHLTFDQLNRESDLLAAGMLANGFEPGMRTVLMVKPSLAFFSLTFALFKMGAVPVLIDPGMGLKNLKTCLLEAQPEAFIGIAKAHYARILLGWPSGRVRVCVGGGWPFGGLSLATLKASGQGQTFQMMVPPRESAAAILFTSGSTGVPKGVIYSHGTFDAQVQMLQGLYGIEPGEIDLCTFPLFALFAPALGMTAIVPDMDFTRPAQVDPEKLRTAIEDFGCTNMFGSPALLNRVGRWAEGTGHAFPTLRRVISAGAPVQAPILERFCKVLADGVQVFTPYGATEALPVASIGSDTIFAETAVKAALGKGICVGHPADGVTVHAIAISDEPIEHFTPGLCVGRGEVGEIIVASPSVTLAYYQRDASTRLAKMRDEAGVVYHRMGDLGYLDDQGRIWFCGRKSHRVVTTSGTLFTVQVEGVFNRLPQVFRTALVGVGPKGNQRPVVCVELEKNASVNRVHLMQELRTAGAEHSHTSAIDTFLIHREFPVDIRHNAKIFREKLAVWASGQLP